MTLENSPNESQELRERLIELFDLMSNNLATSENEHELSVLLETPQGRREYLKIVQQEVLLENDESLFSDSLSQPEALQSSINRIPSKESPLSSSMVSTHRNWLLGILSLAATVSVALMILSKAASHSVVDNHPIPSPTVTVRDTVILTQEAGAEFFAEHTPKAGTAMQMNHEYSLVGGQLELEFAKGATAILEAPCMFEITSGELLKLTYGNCSVHAPEGAEGFRVLTPAADVIDLGTRFHVQVTDLGDSNVQVIEGEAKVLPLEGETTSAPVLTGGNAARFARRESREDDILPFDDSSYRRNLPDRIVGYSTSGPDRASHLESITVQRDGKVMTYHASDLIGADVVSFCESSVGKRANGNLLAPDDYMGDGHELALHDFSLVTGIVNPGGSLVPQSSDPVLPGIGIAPHTHTPGMSLRFHKPIVNGPGPDLVVFDLQTTTNLPIGDAFHLLPLKFRDGLKPHTIKRYDIPITSSASHRVVEFQLLASKNRPSLSLEDLIHSELVPHHPGPRFWALAVGVDLSDLGYAPGETVQELFLQDAGDDEDYIDPVFIGGFPDQVDAPQI